MKITNIFNALLTTGFIGLVVASLYSKPDYSGGRVVAATAEDTRVKMLSTASVARGLPMDVKIDEPVQRTQRGWPGEVTLKTKNTSRRQVVRFKVRLLNGDEGSIPGLQMLTDMNQTYTMPPGKKREVHMLYKVNENFTNPKMQLDFQLVPEE